MNYYLGLVHHPIKNKRGDIVTTSVTNLDLHDISRSCRTFGIKKYFIITPLEAQHSLIQKILGHWEEDNNNTYNPDRSSALSVAKLANNIEAAKNEIREIEGKDPLVIVTGANFPEWDEFCAGSHEGDRPVLILFGTGWGLTEDIVKSADFKLKPIVGMAQDGYNHLSVRSAVAIYLDRLNKA